MIRVEWQLLACKTGASPDWIIVVVVCCCAVCRCCVLLLNCYSSTRTILVREADLSEKMFVIFQL